MEKIREKFEELMALKGLRAEWNGTRYKQANTQVKWLYFYYGWSLSQGEE